MGFFDSRISEEEWQKRFKEIAENYDKNQPFQGQTDSLTTEQLKKIALAQKINEHIDASTEEKKSEKGPSSTPSK